MHAPRLALLPKLLCGNVGRLRPGPIFGLRSGAHGPKCAVVEGLVRSWFSEDSLFFHHSLPPSSGQECAATGLWGGRLKSLAVGVEDLSLSVPSLRHGLVDRSRMPSFKHQHSGITHGGASRHAFSGVWLTRDTSNLIAPVRIPATPGSDRAGEYRGVVMGTQGGLRSEPVRDEDCSVPSTAPRLSLWLKTAAIRRSGWSGQTPGSGNVGLGGELVRSAQATRPGRWGFGPRDTRLGESAAPAN